MTEYHPSSESLPEETSAVQGPKDAGFPAAGVASFTTGTNSTPAPAPSPDHVVERPTPPTPGETDRGGDAADDCLDLEAEARAAGITLPRRSPRRKGRRLVPPQPATPALTAAQRLLLLDTWLRSALPAADFAALVGVSKHTLYAWKKRFDQQGPGGLMDQPRGARRGSRLPDLASRDGSA